MQDTIDAVGALHGIVCDYLSTHISAAQNDYKQKQRGISLPAVMTGLVSAIVAAVLGLALLVFMSVYIRTTVQMAMTNSQQSVVQVANTEEDYVEDMKQVMNSISASYKKTLEERKSTIDTIMKLRSYVVAVYCYDERGM